MAKPGFQRIERPTTAEERQRHDNIRAQVMQEFPPAESSAHPVQRIGIPAQIRAAREAKSLTWHAVAQLAGLADSGTVRDIESGVDVQLSDMQSVAKALGMRLELVEESV